MCPGSEVEKCEENDCSDYRGYQRETYSGKTCQAWNTQEPHEHFNTPKKKPGIGLDENYCRNPDGAETMWCYTTDPEQRWEYCEPLKNAFVKEQECNTEICPRDCEGSWSEWSECTLECGSGVQTARYTIYNDAAGEGKACDNQHDELKERICNTDACPQDCAGEWGAWGECSKTCDTGLQLSFFGITQQKVGSGAECQPGNIETCTGTQCDGYRGYQA